jgi:hypothetical protein
MRARVRDVGGARAEGVLPLVGARVPNVSLQVPGLVVA